MNEARDMTYEQYEQAGFYRSAAEIIEDLERQLAAVTAERDELRERNRVLNETIDRCVDAFNMGVADSERFPFAAQIAELRERLQRCEQDAARYQWLKTHCDLADLSHEPDTQIQIEDAAIDAALHTEAK